MNPTSAPWQPQSQLITPADLPHILAQHRVVVVHCDAVWDRAAAILDSTIQEVRRSFTEDVGFYALDIDLEANRQFCNQYGFMSIPACVCFVDGLWQEMFIGAVPDTTVRAKVQTLVTTPDNFETTLQGRQRWEFSNYSYASRVYSRWLARYPSVLNGITTRKNEDRENNLSFSVTSDIGKVRENRTRICEAMTFTPEQLIVPAQTHGANVAVVGAEDAGRGALSPDTAIPDCDALVTNTPGLLLGITIADCLPLFFLDPIHNVIGLAHSGWRGTARRIAVRTLETMTARFGTHPAACLIAIGPGIGPDGYEVDERVHSGFAPDDAQAEGVFAPTRPGHWRLDLFAAVTHQLRQAGVPTDNFDICPYRTDRDTDLFFSHRLVPGCGRMGAFLGLRDT